MKAESFANFDTHAAVKHLHAAGLEDKVAEAIVDSISISRKADLSNLVSKDDFFDFKEDFFHFKEEVNEKFSHIDKRFDNVDKEITLIKKEIHDLRKDTKTDLESFKKDITTEFESKILANKTSLIQWMVGLFMAQVTTMVVLFLGALIKSHF